MTLTTEEGARVARQLSLAIQPTLRGLHGGVVGSALADLVSLYFAGHHPSIREEVMSKWFECVRDLVPESEKEVRQKFGGRLPWDQKEDAR